MHAPAPLRRYRRWLAPTVAFAVVALLTLTVTLLLDRTADRQIEDRLMLRGETLVSSIQHGVDSAQEHIEAVVGLFRASEKVTAAEYAGFVGDLGLAGGMAGLAYMPVVAAEDLETFEESVASATPAYTVFEIDPDGNRVTPRSRELYFPVQFFEPSENLDQPLGLDAGSPPGRLPYLMEAVNSAQATATPLVELATTGEEGFIIYSPVRDDSGSVVALAAGPVVLSDLITAEAPPSLARALAWTITDITDAGPSPADDGLVYTGTVTVADRVWEIEMTPAEGSALLTDRFGEYWILAAGLLLALGVAIAIYTSARSSAASQRIAALTDTLEAKDKFAATMSHALRTPLTGVLGFAEILRDPASQLTVDERADLAASIAEEAGGLANIINDLLVMNRAEDDTLTTETVPVDLVAETTRVLEEQRLIDRVPIESASTRSNPIGDPAQVRQIVRNLVSNAVEYGGPNIRVVIEPDDGQMTLAVIDDGKGIPDGHEEKIFDPYHRAHTTTSQPGKIGLGLSVSRTLAHNMGGRLVHRRVNGETVLQLDLSLRTHPDPSTRRTRIADGTTAHRTVSAKARQAHGRIRPRHRDARTCRLDRSLPDGARVDFGCRIGHEWGLRGDRRTPRTVADPARADTDPHPRTPPFGENAVERVYTAADGRHRRRRIHHTRRVEPGHSGMEHAGGGSLHGDRPTAPAPCHASLQLWVDGNGSGGVLALRPARTLEPYGSFHRHHRLRAHADDCAHSARYLGDETAQTGRRGTQTSYRRLQPRYEERPLWGGGDGRPGGKQPRRTRP